MALPKVAGGFKGVKDEFAPVPVGTHRVRVTKFEHAQASEQSVAKWMRDYAAEAADLNGEHPGIIKIEVLVLDVTNEAGEAKRKGWRNDSLTRAARSMLMRDLIALGHTPEEFEAEGDFNFREQETYIGIECGGIFKQDPRDDTKTQLDRLVPADDLQGTNLP